MNYVNHHKTDCRIFMFSSKFLIIFFYIYENLSGKYYKKTKNRPQKKLVKNIKVFLKKKKKKYHNMIVNDTKFYQKMKNNLIIIIRHYYFKNND